MRALCIGGPKNGEWMEMDKRMTHTEVSYRLTGSDNPTPQHFTYLLHAVKINSQTFYFLAPKDLAFEYSFQALLDCYYRLHNSTR